MRSIGHFIGGKEVKGTSGRTADVFEPMTGDVQAKVALASKAEVRAAVENAKAAQVEWAATNPQRRARVMMKFLELAQRDYDKLADLPGARAWQDRSRRQGRHPARPRSGGIRLRHSASDEGRIHRRRRPRHRHLFDAPAARRRRRHHAVQFPGDDPDVEIRARDRLRQCVHPEAVGARSRRADDACRADDRGRPAGRASSTSSTATRKRSTPSSTIPISRRSASSAPRRSRNISTSARPRPASARSASAAPRTTPSSCRTPTWTRPSTR